MSLNSSTAAQAAVSSDTIEQDTATLERLMAARHSCRGFLPDLVPRETIERILRIAQRTASWCNTQPWHLTIASGAGAKRYSEALLAWASEHAPNPDFVWPEYAGESLARRRECGFALYDSVGIVKGDREASKQQGLENFRLFGAPHVALITTDAPLGVYGAVDIGGYVSTFLTAIQSLGLGAIAQAALASHADFTRQYFGFPEGRKLVCGISFGYENTAHPANGFRTTRVDTSEAVNWVDA
ncbi:MAG: nitroreductase [Janthinobacterium lividum]